MKAAPYRTVIDCDPGRDDALAILAALGSPALDVELVTTVAGNVTLERATSNALRVLAVAGARDIPVYQGASRPLRHSYTPGSALHGDLASTGPALPEPLATPAGDAHSVLLDWVSEPSDRPRRLVAIAPLTNVGRLLQENDQALRNIDDVFVMGGSVSRMATRVSETAEFNFHTDPEAAGLLMQSGARIWLYDYDATTSCQIPVDAIKGIAASVGDPLGPIAASWLRHLWEHANRPHGRAGVAIHDLYAVAGAAGVEPGRWEHHQITVDTTEDRRGTLDARQAQPSDPHAIAVARDLDPNQMLSFLIESLSALNQRLISTNAEGP